MTKANPDVVIRFAIKLNGSDRKSFNAAMRAEFPRITDYMLRKAWEDSRLLFAIQQYTRSAKHDES